MDHPTLPVVGSHRLNQLGGAYINGKPLPKEIRHEILALALQGFRPCDISRRLRITHGCISKLLSKYRKTGSIQPGGESVGRPRVITPRIAQRIMEYRKEQPGLFSWEIRDRLVQESLCSKESLPSRSSICRLLKNKDKLDTAPGIIQERNSNSYMIASILNLQPSNGQSSSSIPLSMASTSLDSNGQIANQKQTGSHRLNQLGGAYINGKPLPKDIRHEILALALQGFRPCDISRRLRITRGCISQLLSKYHKTGSIQPGGESVGRPRVITPRIPQRIMEYRKEQPGLFSWEKRDRLVQESLCGKESLPSLSSISRLLKNKDKLDTAPGIIQERNSNSYMIASILNLPSNEQSSSSIPSSMASTSIDGNRQIAEQKQTAKSNPDVSPAIARRNFPTADDKLRK